MTMNKTLPIVMGVVCTGFSLAILWSGPFLTGQWNLYHLLMPGFLFLGVGFGSMAFNSTYRMPYRFFAAILMVLAMTLTVVASMGAQHYSQNTFLASAEHKNETIRRLKEMRLATYSNISRMEVAVRRTEGSISLENVRSDLRRLKLSMSSILRRSHDCDAPKRRDVEQCKLYVDAVGAEKVAEEAASNGKALAALRQKLSSIDNDIARNGSEAVSPDPSAGLAALLALFGISASVVRTYYAALWSPSTALVFELGAILSFHAIHARRVEIPREEPLVQESVPALPSLAVDVPAVDEAEDHEVVPFESRANRRRRLVHKSYDEAVASGKRQGVQRQIAVELGLSESQVSRILSARG